MIKYFWKNTVFPFVTVIKCIVHKDKQTATKTPASIINVWTTLNVAHCPQSAELTLPIQYKELNCLMSELKCCLDTTNDVPMLMNADFINAMSLQIILAM